MTDAIDYRVLEDAAYAAGLDPGDAIYPDYSGRAMYGATCLGLVYEHEDEYLDFVTALTEHGIRLRGARRDSMGMRAIAYWPGIEVHDAPDDDDH